MEIVGREERDTDRIEYPEWFSFRTNNWGFSGAMIEKKTHSTLCRRCGA
jgi:hypothetical protein